MIYKHSILRTKLIYSPEEKCLKQYIKPMPDEFLTSNHDDYYSFQISMANNEQEFDQIMIGETNKHYFNLDTGIVFRCNVVKMNHDRLDDQDTLIRDDVIVLNLHHSAFDGRSVEPFIKQLELAYKNPESMADQSDKSLRYIDYTINELRMLQDDSPDSEMNIAREFWKTIFNGYDINKPNKVLPYDYCETVEIVGRSGFGGTLCSSIEDEELVCSMLTLVQEHNVSMFQLFLTCYHLFIYKLTDDNDVLIDSITANRYRPEIEYAIGMFLSFFPYRLAIDPNMSFIDLLSKVHGNCVNILQHSKLPLPEILNIQYSGNPRMDRTSSTVFFFETDTYKIDEVVLEDAVCKFLPDADRPAHISKFDLLFSVKHDVSDTGQPQRFFLLWNYSTDLFTEKTISKMDKQFRHLLNILFSKSSMFDINQQPLYELSLFSC
ncbi:unnamed protein product [Didymodactylos carnosus]|uniref:Condensation domain-containing protein n=1 Tax=Didymodactylos carnosus TaxID=1234261 RepID=A0A8S2CNW7_9BILA|nr:unnamed protein product [Didymodactylos carnosus]CAF3542701.1 unnamed protein product [Didymodactylos carnosus]